MPDSRTAHVGYNDLISWVTALKFFATTMSIEGQITNKR